MFYYEEVSLSWFIVNLFTLVTYIRLIIKILEKIPEVLISNVSNGKPCLLFLIWPFGTEVQRGIQPLTGSSHIIILFWRGKFPLFQTIKIIRDFQDNVFLAILDLPVFPNIAPSTTCHFRQCGIFKPRTSSKWINHDKYLVVELQLLGTSFSCHNNNCTNKLLYPALTLSIWQGPSQDVPYYLIIWYVSKSFIYGRNITNSQ